MKNILFINGTNNIGGGELSLLSIAKYYNKSSSIVSFGEGDYTHLLKKEGIHSIVLKNSSELLDVKREQGIFGIVLKLKFLFLTLFEIRNISKEYDVIYCNSQKAILLSLLALLFNKKKIIIHVRDMMDNPNISSFQRKVFTWLVNISEPVIIANSAATKNALVSIGIKKKIEIVFNGIKENENLKIKDTNKFIVAMFSRISHWKGQEYFIEAIHLLQNNKDFNQFEFWIVGDAVMGSEEEKYKKKILSLIKQYNLENSVKLFGFIDDPMRYMKDIDVLVLPSIYPEPFGRVVVEAMLLQKVVIATNMGGVKEIIENDKSGLLVDLDHLADNLANNFLSLYKNQEKYKSLANEGYLRAKKYFTEEKMLSHIDTIIKGLH